jgi:hypothetical protein
VSVTDTFRNVLVSICIESAEQSYFVHTCTRQAAKRTAAIKKPQIQPRRPQLKAHALSTATLKELQAHCKDRGLNASGTKAVLVERLAECTSPVSGQRGTRRSGVQKNEVRIQLGSIVCYFARYVFTRYMFSTDILLFFWHGYVTFSPGLGTDPYPS